MNYYLSPKEKIILILLFTYRGMRAKDLVVFYTKSYNYSLSDEKSIYNYLAKMKRKGLIKATRLQGVDSLGSIYYLTQPGHELAKQLLNISVGQQGTGKLPANEETVFWDVPFEFQTPPLKQTNHFIMTIDFFKQLVTSDKSIEHYTAFYSNLNYSLHQAQRKVKPDAAVRIHGCFYAIEIDRASESHEQLIEKFRKYKEYHDFYCQAEDKTGLVRVNTILFVVEARSRQHGIKRRWTNVLSAFFKAFGEDFPSINLLLVPLNEVQRTLEFELDRFNINAKHLEDLKAYFVKDGYTNITELKRYLLARNENNQCQTIFNHLHLEFESRIYYELYYFKIYTSKFEQVFRHLFEPGKELEGVEYLKGRGYWQSPFETPKFAEGIETTNLSPVFLDKIKAVEPYFKYYSTLK